MSPEATHPMQPVLHVHRVEALTDRTLGRLRAYDGGGVLRFEGWALEPPWRDAVGASCVPCGLYGLAWRVSRRYGRHLLVEGTGPRSLILLHAGNYPRDTRGCLLPGLRRRDLDGDGVADVAASRKALRAVEAVVEAATETRPGEPVARLLITRA